MTLPPGARRTPDETVGTRSTGPSHLNRSHSRGALFTTLDGAPRTRSPDPTRRLWQSRRWSPRLRSGPDALARPLGRRLREFRKQDLTCLSNLTILEIVAFLG